jgi:hypothetical protein
MRNATRAVCLALTVGGFHLWAGPTWAQGVGGIGLPGASQVPGMVAPSVPNKNVILGQLAAWFTHWDKDKDGYLDKEELAKAFRGSKAKPVEASADKETSEGKSTKLPADAKFLEQLDTDGDGKISRKEFDAWAKDYSDTLIKWRTGVDNSTNPSGTMPLAGGVPLLRSPWLVGRGGNSFAGPWTSSGYVPNSRGYTFSPGSSVGWTSVPVGSSLSGSSMPSYSSAGSGNSGYSYSNGQYYLNGKPVPASSVPPAYRSPGATPTPKPGPVSKPPAKPAPKPPKGK